MKKIGYIVTARDLVTNKLIATMEYGADERKTMLEEVKHWLTTFETPVCLRASRETRLFRDVQWYGINTQETGPLFSRRKAGGDRSEPWATIYKHLRNTAKKLARPMASKKP
jgi:hypothetical protein